MTPEGCFSSTRCMCFLSSSDVTFGSAGEPQRYPDPPRKRMHLPCANLAPTNKCEQQAAVWREAKQGTVFLCSGTGSANAHHEDKPVTLAGVLPMEHDAASRMGRTRTCSGLKWTIPALNVRRPVILRFAANASRMHCLLAVVTPPHNRAGRLISHSRAAVTKKNGRTDATSLTGGNFGADF
eukprot:2519950-Rhodomonas_salina.3